MENNYCFLCKTNQDAAKTFADSLHSEPCIRKGDFTVTLLMKKLNEKIHVINTSAQQLFGFGWLEFFGVFCLLGFSFKQPMNKPQKQTNKQTWLKRKFYFPPK